MKKIKSENKIAPWNCHLDKKYGKRGTVLRTDFEVKAQSFILKFSSIRGLITPKLKI